MEVMIDYYLKEAVYIKDYILKLKFRNGYEGTLDFSKYIGKIKAYDTFRKQKNKFEKFSIINGYLMEKLILRLKLCIMIQPVLLTLLILKVNSKIAQL